MYVQTLQNSWRIHLLSRKISLSLLFTTVTSLINNTIHCTWIVFIFHLFSHLLCISEWTQETALYTQAHTHILSYIGFKVSWRQGCTKTTYCNKFLPRWNLSTIFVNFVFIINLSLTIGRKTYSRVCWVVISTSDSCSDSSSLMILLWFFWF